jgi:nucleotide-binding universal stress UspA family protein
MSPFEIAIGLVLLAAIILLLRRELERRRTDAAITPAAKRILFPFLGEALSSRAFDVALRVARAEGATLVPAYIAIVPLSVDLDTPLKKEAETALPLLEAIEQRAATQDVPVDSRIQAGRTVRHAFRLLLEEEQFDRVIAPATAANGDGFSADDVAWMLQNVPAEISILRPALESSESARSPRDERGNDRVARVLFRVPEHAKGKATVA